MSTRKETVEDLRDALSAAEPLSIRAMFGEYAVYLDGRVVALICDDTLYVKPVPGVLAALPGRALAPPYPGAKPHVAVPDALDDPDPVIEALRAAAHEVPLPKPKKRAP